MTSCRTAALGGHTQVCPEGHHTQVWYNSCRYRACPQCAQKPRFDTRRVYNNHDKDEAGRGKPAVMTLPAEELLRRLFLHIPPPRMVTIRSYGLYATSKSETLNACRTLLGQAPAEKPASPTWQDLAARCGEQHPECCPVCGRRLVVGDIIEPRRGTVIRLPQPYSGAPPARTPRVKAA